MSKAKVVSCRCQLLDSMENVVKSMSRTKTTPLNSTTSYRGRHATQPQRLEPSKEAPRGAALNASTTGEIAAMTRPALGQMTRFSNRQQCRTTGCSTARRHHGVKIGAQNKIIKTMAITITQLYKREQGENFIITAKLWRLTRQRRELQMEKATFKTIGIQLHRNRILTGFLQVKSLLRCPRVEEHLEAAKINEFNID